MPLLRRKLLRFSTTILASGVLVLGSVTAAQANDDQGGPSFQSRSSFEGRAPVVSVDVTTDGGFAMPKHVHAGFVTFKVSTPESVYHGFQGFRLKNGATVAQVMEDFRLGVAADTAEEN